MAKAAFKYELDNGDIARVRLDTAIGALGGTPPAGSTTQDFFVEAGGSRRKSTGIRARSARYTRNSGTTENPTIRSLRVVFLTPTAFASAPDTVTYKTATWTRAGKNPEDT